MSRSTAPEPAADDQNTATTGKCGGDERSGTNNPRRHHLLPAVVELLKSEREQDHVYVVWESPVELPHVAGRDELVEAGWRDVSKVVGD